MNTNSNTSEEEGNGLLSSYQAIENQRVPENPVQSPAQISIQNPIEIPISDTTPPEKFSICFFISISFYILTILSLFVFGALLILKLDEDITWSFLKVMVFFYFGMACLLLLANITVVKNSRLFTNFLGKCFLIFCLNSLIVMAICFGVLLTFRLKGDIEWSYSVIFIPIYFIMSIIFIFICFIIPGLVDSNVKMYKEAIIISSQYFACLLTVILVLFKIDENLKLYYFEIFILEEIMLLVLFVVQIVKFQNDASKYLQIENLGIIFALFAGFLLLGLKCDDVIEGAWKFVMIPFYLAYIGGIIKTYRIFNFLYQINNS